MIRRLPSKTLRHWGGGVFKVKAPSLCIILFNEGRGNGGSCQTMEQERAHTHFSFPSLWRVGGEKAGVT